MISRRPALGFIFVTLFLDILGVGLIIPILPKLIEQLSDGNVSAASSTYGWLVALYSLMQFVCAPVLGSLSDRFGRRAVILGSLFGSGVDYLLLAFAPTLPWFFLGRIIAGITGANYTAASAYIADISPPEKRAANFGLLGAAFGLGFIAGPAVGGMLGSFGLRVPFFVAAGLTLLNWLYGAFVLPESLPREHRRTFTWGRANPVGSLLALKRFPVVLGLVETYFLINLAHQVLPSTWVLYTSYRYEWTPKQVGLSLAIVGIMSALVQGGLARRVIPALGERRAIILGLVNGTVFMSAYGLAQRGWMIYAIIVVGSFGALAGPAIQGLISRSVPMNEQGAVQGSLSSLASLAGIIGPPVFTGLFGYFISPRAPAHVPGVAFFFGSALIVLALVMALRSFRKQPAEAIPAAQPQTTSPL
ncbi:MAG: TCR/Tet family MFS transporter [Deltaproteobacteria bacterium]|nr:TCR/Tet family MFS transporter [Deltaproteobacteria bacterium]